MRRPSPNAVIASFEAFHEQTRTALASGFPLCGVAHFSQQELPDSSLLLEAFEGNTTLVRVELLVPNQVLPANARFELRAGTQVLARGRILSGPAVQPCASNHQDKPAPKQWQGTMGATLWM